MTINVGDAADRTVSVRFGSATYSGPAPDPETVRRNIAAGQESLARGLEALMKPGVKLKKVKGSPLFSADPVDPTVLIRDIDGNRERVTFQDGAFKVVA